MYLTGQRKKCISFFLVGILGFVTIAGAVLTAPVLVYALSLAGLRGTIASLIISLMLEAGVAPVNNTWVNSLNNAFGVESSIGTIDDMITNGLLTESGGTLIDTGLSQAIEATAEYTSLGIDDIFTTLSTDAGVVANSGAVNLANQAIHLGTAGTIGAFAGAVAVGVGVGVLVNHLREKFTNFIKYGFPMNANEYLTQNVSGYNGYVYFIQTYDSRLNRYRIRKIILQSGRIGSAFYNNNGQKFDLFNVDPNAITYLRKSNYNLDTGAESDITENSIVGTNSYSSSFSDTYLVIADNYIPHFDTLQEYEAYKSDVQNGIITLPNIYSPDLIGQNGNQTYNDSNNNVPDIRNIVPDGHDMTPVDMDDYLDYVDQANDNTDNDDVGQEVQGQEFEDFVNPYFQPIPDEPITPDDPVGPEQPEFPVKPTPSPEDIESNLVMTPDENLKDKFPFCIPFDIYDLISGLVAEREAPVITCPVDVSGNTVTVDLSEYDSIAELLRLLELILFIIGLAVATRSLIGASGGG